MKELEFIKEEILRLSAMKKELIGEKRLETCAQMVMEFHMRPSWFVENVLYPWFGIRRKSQ